MDLDGAIGQVSELYRAVTGREMPQDEVSHSPIPAESDPVQHVHEQMDRLLMLLAGPAALHAGSTPSWAPPVTIYESTREVVVAVDVPGTTRDEVDVRVEAGVLVVSGQRPTMPGGGGQRVRHVEVRFGTFRRVVPLPPGLRTSEMSARLDQGVLEVRIPRDGANGVRPVAVA